MWYAHDRGLDNQAPAGAMVRLEHAYVVAEGGRSNCKLMCVDVLQPHGIIRGGLYRGGVSFQVPSKDVAPVRRKLDGGQSECMKSTPSMELSGETAKEGGGRATSVRNFLSSFCPGSTTFWGGELGFVAGNVLKTVGGALGITKADNRT